MVPPRHQHETEQQVCKGDGEKTGHGCVHPDGKPETAEDEGANLDQVQRTVPHGCFFFEIICEHHVQKVKVVSRTCIETILRFCPFPDRRWKVSEKSDPRPARTRALLFDALLQLIQQKRWEHIRVQDILAKSGVGRSTFYSHFDNKFDLLTSEIPALTMPISDADGRPDLLPLFLHVEEMAPVMKPLLTQPLLAEVIDTFHRRLVSAWDAHFCAIGVREERRLMASELLASGLLSVSKRWLVDGCTRGVEQMAAEFQGYVSVVTAEALREGQPHPIS